MQLKSCDYKESFNICSKLLNRNANVPLPKGILQQQLAHEFSEFITDKIKNIKINLSKSIVDTGKPYTEKTHGVDPYDILTSVYLQQMMSGN